jgi:hypothetical protein
MPATSGPVGQLPCCDFVRFLVRADWSEFLYRKKQSGEVGPGSKTRTFPWRGNGEHLLKG